MTDNIIQTDERYMRRCLDLASMAEGHTSPNPMVGSVIVCDGRIIGEGYHRKAGTPHAEVNAVESVTDKALLCRSTLYVNLEPCAHWGRTPPCAKLIIDSRIPEVVVGCVDTFSAVSGKGIEMMREAGVNVRVGVLEEECRRLNRRFFTYHEKRRPYIILKWAESADGYIDASPTSAQRPVWLTNDACRRLVHKQRTTEGAVVIGVNTALLDNPSLTPRMWKGAQPLRVIIDPRLRAPETLTLLSDELPTLILNAERDAELAPGKTLRRIDFGRGGVGAVLDELYRMQIQSIIVEGGSVTLRHFIDEGLWDEAWRYRGKAYLADGVRAPRLRYDPQEIKQMRTLIIDDAMLDIIEKKH